MTTHSFTDAQVDKARHALGLDRNGRANRNCYSSNLPDPDWEDLVTRGMAIKYKSPTPPGWFYHLTEQAAYCFLDPGERLDPDVCFAILDMPDRPEPEEWR